MSPGTPLDIAYKEERLDLVEKGCVNLQRHIENTKKFGVKVVCAINRFGTDTEKELMLVHDLALKAGADACVVANHWAKGGKLVNNEKIKKTNFFFLI